MLMATETILALHRAMEADRMAWRKSRRQKSRPPAPVPAPVGTRSAVAR